MTPEIQAKEMVRNRELMNEIIAKHTGGERGVRFSKATRGGSMTTTVRDVMSTDLVTVEPSTMMTEAAAAMSSARVGSVLVLEEGALVGIFTERDILSAFEQFRADPARVSPVSKGMTWNPLTI
ncbi:MAG: CBS domain-containing protein, partial [Actinomycetota bacterium]|nr:CBS domain-containing protein [Actinomycetota bacterium]